MSFFDVMKGSQYKAELDTLQEKYNALLASITPEMRDAISLKQEISGLEQMLVDEQAQLNKLNSIIASKKAEISSLDESIQEKQDHIVWMDDEILVQQFGLYKPQFDFVSSLDYKEALEDIRSSQRNLIKNGVAVTGNANWQVNGDIKKGRKMVSDTQKLLLYAFNLECDELVSKVKYTNFDASLEKMRKSAEKISKLGITMGISITQQYLATKTKELRLAFEYACKKQQEKEEQRAARAEQREQAKVQRELEEQRRRIEKEQTHYQTAFEKLKAQLALQPDNPDLLNKQTQMEKHLDDIDKALSDIDYRQANMKAGYVYVISNIGAFGENVYKIGMTRRLDPQERIDELGDASVPFNFDVHAMIFSDDAPALEAALHRAFEDRKLNMVNQRRDFFRVSLDEIKEVVRKNFDKTVEFIDVPNAEQYRISLKMKNSKRTS